MIAALLSLLLAVAAPAASVHDGRHDFDFEIGTWRMAPSGNLHVVRKLWDGATIGQLVVLHPAREVRGSLLSLYVPASDTWNVYWADARDGSLSPPLSGRFRNGVGTFEGRDAAGGRAVLVRLVISKIRASSFQTDQSVSKNGGATWGDHNVQTYARVGPLGVSPAH